MQVVQLSENVIKYTFIWILFKFIQVPISVYTITTPQGKILVDCGHASFAKEFKVFLKDHTFKYLIITHGHVDHIGNLDSVVQFNPSITVICHKLEYDFIKPITNNRISKPLKKFSSIKGDTIAYNMLSKLGVLEEASWPQFDFNVSIQVIDTLEYTLGAIKIIHTPGHTLGHVSVLIPSDSIALAGDLFSNLRPFSLFRTLDPVVSRYFISTVNNTLVKSSLVQLYSSCKQKSINTIYPSHDSGNGVELKAIKDLK